MDTIPPTNEAVEETGSEEIIASPLFPDLVLRPISKAARRQALEGIPELRSLREEIRAHRGGKPISLDEIVGALHEARITSEPRPVGTPISLDQLVVALHEARAAHEWRK